MDVVSWRLLHFWRYVFSLSNWNRNVFWCEKNCGKYLVFLYLILSLFDNNRIQHLNIPRWLWLYSSHFSLGQFHKKKNSFQFDNHPVPLFRASSISSGSPFVHLLNKYNKPDTPLHHCTSETNKFINCKPFDANSETQHYRHRDRTHNNK